MSIFEDVCQHHLTSSCMHKLSVKSPNNRDEARVHLWGCLSIPFVIFMHACMTIVFYETTVVTIIASSLASFPTIFLGGRVMVSRVANLLCICFIYMPMGWIIAPLLFCLFCLICMTRNSRCVVQWKGKVVYCIGLLLLPVSSLF